MSKQTSAPSEALGLDIGTSRIVCAWRKGAGDYHFDSQLNAFVSVPNSKMRQKALGNENIPFSEDGDQLMVSGDHAPGFADLLNLETRRPMTNGVLNPSETESLTVLKQIVRTLAEKAAKPGAKIYFSVPAPALNRTSDENLTYHEASLRQTFEQMGYSAEPINEGLAVIYSELEDSNYTGIGISLGGGLCNVALAYLSMPAITFSIPKAGDFIDSSAAAVTGDLANRVRLAKEQTFHFNGASGTKLHQALTVYYQDVIDSLVAAIGEAFSGSRRLPRFAKPVPVVISGGTALPEGFRDRFEKALRAAEIPIAISEVRLASDPLNTTARGALVAALTEM
jgi:hypothetical protein